MNNLPKATPIAASEFDLRDHLAFSPEEGRLALGSERYMLFSQLAFGVLRGLIFDQLGETMARSLLTKFGFQNGSGDFRTLSAMFDFKSESDCLAAGPMMHSWSGIVHVEPRLMEMDRATGHFHFKGIWHNSYEAEVHLQRFGVSAKPVCHSLTGYGSGWCSAFFGRPLLEIETKCVGCGDSHCEWEIKPWDEWGPEADAWKEALRSTPLSIYRTLEQSEQKVREMNASLEAEVQRRTKENQDLVRMLCHDVSVPLELVKNSAKALTQLVQATESLSDIVTHVRERQAADAGKKGLKLRPVDLRDAMAKARVIFKTRLENKGLALTFTESLGDEAWVLADPVCLSNNILNNLIANAIKFSPRNGVVHVHAERAGKAGERVCISVSDNGIGIPQRILDVIFDPNAETSRPGTAGEPGTGFGLPLVKTSVDLHGGEIEIDSRSIEAFPNESGTTCRVFLQHAGRPVASEAVL